MDLFRQRRVSANGNLFLAPVCGYLGQKNHRLAGPASLN
jgi:hypothetical protein